MSLEIITLFDETSGARARILPGFGFNCFSFQTQSADGPVELLWAEDGVTSGEARPSGSGIPLLFPFPGRIRQGRFRFGEREYTIPPSDGRGNAIHGFVLNRPWQVTHHTTAQVTGEFHAATVDPRILHEWPADFRLRVTYALTGQTLAARIVVENPSDDPLPAGFGAHPYFRLPLGAGSMPADCRVTVPVASYWELVDLLPTGRRLPADGLRALGDGLPLDGHEFDDVFTGLTLADGHCTATIFDPGCGLTLTIRFDEAFRHAVVYTPPHREAICIEPYTCVPDPFWLEDAGIASGLRIIPPRGSFAAEFSIGID